MRQHTRGPWTVGIMTETGLPGVMQVDGPVIAEITKWTSVGRSDSGVIQANAQLIAESPSLLFELEYLVQNIEDIGIEMSILGGLGSARAVIDRVRTAPNPPKGRDDE